ncbi:hypothetical protein [Sphingomonas sp. NPDC079357]|uniref:hypothetical protein n=1 Tax=Sphingomonas sp. NPDC079357 TaxID=3364518 RepID=UPI00384BC395
MTMPENFTSRMCHMMRTQIGIIVGLTDIINLHDDDLGSQSREDLARIRAAAKAMLSLVEQIEQPFDDVI